MILCVLQFVIKYDDKCLLTDSFEKYKQTTIVQLLRAHAKTVDTASRTRNSSIHAHTHPVHPTNPTNKSPSTFIQKVLEQKKQNITLPFSLQVSIREKIDVRKVGTKQDFKI